MLINQILFQQKLGQESNYTVFLTKTRDINGLWSFRGQKEGWFHKAWWERNRVQGKAGLGKFKVVLLRAPGHFLEPWSVEAKLPAHLCPASRFPVQGIVNFIRGSSHVVSWTSCVFQEGDRSLWQVS